MAKAYTQQDVFSRLSGQHPTHHESSDEQPNAADPGVQCFDDSSPWRGNSRSPQRSSSSRQLLSVDLDSDGSQSVGNAMLHSFLSRQNEKEEVRLRRLREIEIATTPHCRPSLCLASRRMARRRQNCSSMASPKAAPYDHKMEQCTFKPAINQASARLPRRGVSALSSGDLLRREAHAAALSQRHQAELDASLASASFEPQLYRAPSWVEIE